MSQRVYTQTYGVVGAILEKDGKILLVQEKEVGPHDNGKWNQPAGWIDVGEDPVEAVKREVLEETGLTFQPTGLLGIYSLVRKDYEAAEGQTRHSLKLIFIGKIAGGQELESSEEIGSVKWYTQAEIEAMGTDTLRDVDIKKEVADYFKGKNFSLDIINHTIRE